MEGKDTSSEGPLPGQETVRCLDCGGLYRKPVGGGTVSANPGCPDCGYVGWVLAPKRVTPPLVQDLPRRKSA